MEASEFVAIPESTLQQIRSSHALVALKNIATRLRIHCVKTTAAAGSGHPTSCSSIAEVFAVLFFDSAGMRYFPTDPQNFNNDKVVLSKGHAAPILYAAWAEAGLFSTADLMNLRKFGDDLEGHPTPRLPFVDVSTGSLGQGISAACGMAYSMKYVERTAQKVFTIMGDGECAEGSVWEAFNFASHYNLDNLIGVIDVNRIGQSDFTMFQQDLRQYVRRLDAFGWHTIVIDGHSLEQVIYAFQSARDHQGSPIAIIAKTYKGNDFGPQIKDQLNWHGKPLAQAEEIVKHLESLLTETAETTQATPPTGSSNKPAQAAVALPEPTYELGAQVATRNAYGDALAALVKLDQRVFGLDGDTKNSTMSMNLQQASPANFVECFIAEQNMAGVALGLSTRGLVPFASTFAAFLSRAFDQVRMCGLSWGNVKFVGSHCGCSIGEDGGSQMALEDLASFRAIPGCLVLYPSDGVSSYRAVEIAFNYSGPVYIRNTRPATSVIYPKNAVFAPGKSIVVKTSASDQVLVIGAGVTLHEALKAWETLQAEGIHVRVVDLFSIKPLDTDLLRTAAAECGNRVLTVEDHYGQGGIFEAVAASLPGVPVRGAYVNDFPRSGKPAELLDHFGLSAAKICTAVRQLLQH